MNHFIEVLSSAPACPMIGRTTVVAFTSFTISITVVITTTQAKIPITAATIVNTKALAVTGADIYEKSRGNFVPGLHPSLVAP